MTKNQYLQELQKNYAEGKISADAYDAGITNMDAFISEASEEDDD